MESCTVRFMDQKEIFMIVPLLREANPKIPEHVLKNRLEEMFHNHYQCVGLFLDGALVGISGLWILTKYYVGKHFEPDNVIISESHRGKGLGKVLVNWMFDYAKSIGCEASELNCYVNNTKGHKFWESLGYQKIAYHFQKKF